MSNESTNESDSPLSNRLSLLDTCLERMYIRAHAIDL